MEGSHYDGGLERLAYDLSFKALERQEGLLDELRSRTGLLLAASSLAASFLGARAAQTGSGIFTALALTAFVVSMAASIYVVFPKPRLIFSLRGSVLLEAEFDDPGGLPETYRRLAYWLERYHDANQEVIDGLFATYRLAALAVLAQVLLWVAEIAL